MAGVPTARIIEILNERHGYDLPVHATADRKEPLYVELVPRVLPVEPVVKLVHAYAGKLPMAVATVGTRAICMKTLTSLKLDGFFAHVVTADDVAHGKPAPDIFLRAAELLGVPPAQCAAFEHGELGLQAARAAGMAAIDIRPMHKAASAAAAAAASTTPKPKSPQHFGCG